MAIISSLAYSFIDKLFITVVADEVVWSKTNTELENKVFVFIMVDSAVKREIKKEIVKQFMSFTMADGKINLLEQFGNLPDNGFFYFINANELYRLFRNQTE